MFYYIKSVAYLVLLSTLSITLHAHTKNYEVHRLACFFYDTSNHHEGVGVMNAGLPSVWAKGLVNEDIFVTGYIEDGFFNVSSMKGKVRGYFGMRLVANYENSLNLAEHFCKRGIQHAYKDHQTKEFVHLGVKSSLMSFKTWPVTFAQSERTKGNAMNKIIVFGDSLSDQGNLKRWLRIFPNGPYFAGRFSDHFIWIDYLQKRTGISVQNWAVGGSVSNFFIDLEFNRKPFRERTRRKAQTIIAGNLSDEIKKFADKSLLNNQLVDAQGTLFSLWIGGNDYISFMESPTDADTFLDFPNDQRVGYRLVIHRVCNTITKSITKLYNLGARNFMVTNMPDLGKLPRILDNQSYHRQIYEPDQARFFSLSQKMTLVSQEHNALLSMELESLRKKLKDIKIIHIDINQKLSDISGNIFAFPDSVRAFNYDFSHEFITQISRENESIIIHHPCYTGSEFRANDALMCQEPKRAVFWDKTHPSSYTHCIIAAHMHNQVAHHGIFAPSKLSDYLRLCRPDNVQTDI